MNAKQYSILFLNFWRSELHHSGTFLADSTQFTKPEKKVHAQMNDLKWQEFTHQTQLTKPEKNKVHAQLNNLKWPEFTHQTQYI